MKEFTAEMLKALTEANNSVKGSTNYSKFYMQTECKNEKGRWFFVGNYIPHNTGKIRTFKDNTYIITESDERYLVSEEVKELLGI